MIAIGSPYLVFGVPKRVVTLSGASKNNSPAKFVKSLFDNHRGILVNDINDIPIYLLLQKTTVTCLKPHAQRKLVSHLKNT